MSETLLLWLLGLVVAMIAGLAKLWWDHLRECRDFRARVAAMEAEVVGLRLEVGVDHDSGMRKRVHALENEVLGARLGQ